MWYGDHARLFRTTVGIVGPRDTEGIAVVSCWSLAAALLLGLAPSVIAIAPAATAAALRRVLVWAVLSAVAAALLVEGTSAPTVSASISAAAALATAFLARRLPRIAIIPFSVPGAVGDPGGPGRRSVMDESD